MTESKMRYKLRKQGYSLKKGKDAYGCNGYMIIEDYNNSIVCGENFTLGGDDVENFIDGLTRD